MVEVQPSQKTFHDLKKEMNISHSIYYGPNQQERLLFGVFEALGILIEETKKTQQQLKKIKQDGIQTYEQNTITTTPL